MSAYVIDTNVPIVANRLADHVSPACVLNCIRRLVAVHNNGIVVLDDGGRILDEYTRHLSRSGQPGAGDFFMKWIWLNQSVPERCEQVHIAPLVNDPENFSEFPTDSRLESFDRSDRKFVAVVKASQKRPTILNATDTDWWDHRVALKDNGVVVEFLCPELFQE